MSGVVSALIPRLDGQRKGANDLLRLRSAYRGLVALPLVAVEVVADHRSVAVGRVEDLRVGGAAAALLPAVGQVLVAHAVLAACLVVRQWGESVSVGLT